MCSKAFETNFPNKKYCSEECYRENHKYDMCDRYNKKARALKKCAYRYCDNTFIPIGNQKFCSSECGYMERKLRKKDKRDNLIFELSKSLYKETNIGE